MVRMWLALLVVGMLGCGIEKGSDIQPTSTLEPAAITSLEPVVVDVGQTGIQVNGPTGCVEASTLPKVVVWEITGLPERPVLDKGYHWDDTVSCEATTQQMRTQNSHLRLITTGPSSVRVEFDRDTEMCRGRQQPDVRWGPNVLVGMIIKRSNGKSCEAPPPSLPVPLPPPPTPPPCPSSLTTRTGCR